MIRSLCFTAAVLVTTATSAQDDEVQKFLGSLKFRTGDIALPDAGATLHLASSFRYLDYYDALGVVRGAVAGKMRAVSFNVDASGKRRVLDSLP